MVESYHPDWLPNSSHENGSHSPICSFTFACLIWLVYSPLRTPKIELYLERLTTSVCRSYVAQQRYPKRPKNLSLLRSNFVTGRTPVPYETNQRGLSLCVIYPRRACAARVSVVGSVCLSVTHFSNVCSSYKR